MWLEPIAIVGIGCRFPESRDLGRLWRTLLDGVDAVSVRPREEWLQPAYVEPLPEAIERCMSFPGGYIDRADLPDGELSSNGTPLLDPQQSAFVQCTAEALSDAGLHDDDELRERVVGVFAGSTNIDYHRWLYNRPASISVTNFLASATSAIANRVSNQFNLQGPSLTIDAACTSGLAAVHLACQSLLSRESDLCLAGAVNLILNPDSTLTFLASGMLSPSGRCRVFSADADGYVRGEGCGVLALERLSRARAAGRVVHGLILGSALNHTGESAGISMPRVSAQVDLIRRAHRAAGVAPEDIGYVEAHATGAPIGDLVELEAIDQVFAGGRAGGAKLAVGSLKTNFGHTEAASGIAGLLKALLIANHRQVPKNLHFNGWNPRALKKQRTLHIPQEREDLGNDRILAGISSFGATGANAHVVISPGTA